MTVLTNNTVSNNALSRIERDILMLGLLLYAACWYVGGPRTAGGALIGVMLAYLNFLLIRRSITRLLAQSAARAPRKYLLFSLFKLFAFAVVIGLLMWLYHPSVISLLLGFSVFMPAVFFEVVIRGIEEPAQGEENSGSRN